MVYYENREYISGFPVNAKQFDGINFLPHWHSEFEIVFVQEGRLLIGINSESKVLVKGDMAIISCGDIHYYENMYNKSKVLIIIFRPELIDRIISLLPAASFKYPFITKETICKFNLPPAVYDEIIKSIDYIYQEIADKKSQYQILTISQLVKLFGLFYRYFPMNSSHSDTAISKGNKIKLIQKALKYIDLHYSNNITCTDVSEYLGISSGYFSKLFNNITSQSFKTYLNSIRIQKATDLIKISSNPIIDIAFECGFNSLRTFNRVFKDINGSPPSALRLYN